MEEASVAGESPDRSKQHESSAEPTSGSKAPVPDPRLAVAREAVTAASRVDTATAVFSTKRSAGSEGSVTASSQGSDGSADRESAGKGPAKGTEGGDARLRDVVAAWVATADEEAPEGASAPATPMARKAPGPPRGPTVRNRTHRVRPVRPGATRRVRTPLRAPLAPMTRTARVSPVRRAVRLGPSRSPRPRTPSRRAPLTRRPRPRTTPPQTPTPPPRPTAATTRSPLVASTPTPSGSPRASRGARRPTRRRISRRTSRRPVPTRRRALRRGRRVRRVRQVRG